MTDATIAQFVAELSEAYTGAAEAREGAATLVKLPNVQLPAGCQPSSTQALVVLDRGQEKPRLLLKTKPRTPAGTDPRNVSPETIAGSGWFSFSFSLAWEKDRHTAVQFVEGALRRFAKNE